VDSINGESPQYKLSPSKKSITGDNFKFDDKLSANSSREMDMSKDNGKA
jgi:hypothetical protein